MINLQQGIKNKNMYNFFLNNWKGDPESIRDFKRTSDLKWSYETYSGYNLFDCWFDY